MEAEARESLGFRPRTLGEMREASVVGEREAGRAAETALATCSLVFAVLRLASEFVPSLGREEPWAVLQLQLFALFQLFMFVSHMVQLARHAAQRHTTRVCEGLDASLRRAAAACAPQCLRPTVLEAAGVPDLDPDSKRLLRSLSGSLDPGGVVVASTARAWAAGSRSVNGCVSYFLGPRSSIEVHFTAVPGARGERGSAALDARDWAGGTRAEAAQMSVDCGAGLPLALLHVTRTMLGRPPGLDAASADAEQASALKGYVDALHALGERQFGPQGGNQVWLPVSVAVRLPGDALDVHAVLKDTHALRDAVRSPNVVPRIFDDVSTIARDAWTAILEKT